MGICYSCTKSRRRFKDKGTKICSSLQSAVSPLHIQQHPIPIEVENNVVAVANKSDPLNGGIAPPLLLPLTTVSENCGSSSGNNKGLVDQKRQSMSNAIKQMVSKRRNRYKKDGFNLDLTYITRNIIAMGYPASNIEGVYRNKIEDVARFLQSEHGDHYKVYNLCSERNYDKSKFCDRVEQFPFDDHNPPKIELIQPFCESVHRWLQVDSKNVAAVHCKAGKGRTGTMICCYLLHSKMFTDPTKALEHYDSKRTQDQKGVTIPSQVRYVHYYGKLLQDNLTYASEVLYVHQIRLEPAPIFVGGQGSVSFSISQQETATDGSASGGEVIEKYKSCMYEVKRNQNAGLILETDSCVPIFGDVKVKFYTKKLYKEKQFHFWVNTFFVSRYNGPNSAGDIELVLRKNELDIVNKKDKQNKAFTEDFKVTVVFRRVPKDPTRWGASPPKSTCLHQGGHHQSTTTTTTMLHDQTTMTTTTGNNGRNQTSLLQQDTTPSVSSSGSGDDDSPECDDDVSPESDEDEDDDDDEDGWDSALEIESTSMDDRQPREFGYRLLSESDLSFPLGSTSSGGGGGGDHLMAA
nr:phosphatidylinositol 3,4,5-trisphosphate 3-phosphatase and dual-specificity protein phosphatase PTEN isoform X2 [Onthophagus taurus]